MVSQGFNSVLSLYQFGDKQYLKLTVLHHCLSNKGVFTSRGSANDQKLDVSIIRAKNKIFELAFCNPWDFYFTGTLDPKKYDRSDLNKFHHDLTRFLFDQGIKYNTKIRFLLVPELHADGKSWHIHGFLFGLPLAALTQFKIGDRMSSFLASKVKAGEILYNWLDYSNKFGFCDLEPIKNHEAVSKYVTKYINKSLSHSVKELNAHLYYRSRGLKTSIILKRGIYNGAFERSNSTFNFSNDYCSFVWLPYSNESFDSLSSSI